MFANLKKMLIIIPCMVIGLFFVTGARIFAADAVLLESNEVLVGEEELKENTYYFTNDKSWEFHADFNLVNDYDTFLKYRVVRPDGSATKWSSKQYYVNNNGKFNISDYTALSYTETVDISSRVSIVPAATYYVDIEYYGEYLGFIDWNQNKGETLKVVVGSSDDNLNIPTANIVHDASAKKYTVTASVLKDEQGYSAITDIEYYFATERKENNTIYDFYKNKDASATNGSIDFTPASQVSVSFNDPEEAANEYVYVVVTTGNGYSTVVEYNIESGDVSKENLEKEADTNSDTGLFDYDFGELILLVLVVVLIVSCALIITQKIVDYKKRLY